MLVTLMFDLSVLPWLQALQANKKYVAADELKSILGDNKEALILDLGAGTGIIGKYVSSKLNPECTQKKCLKSLGGP